jgi:hypothetical protein
MEGRSMILLHEDVKPARIDLHLEAGRWLVRKAREHQAREGTHAAALWLRYMGFPVELAARILKGKP